MAQGFVYHFEPVIVVEESKHEGPLDLEVGPVNEVIPHDDCRSELSVSKFLNNPPGRIEMSDDSADGLL